MADASDRDRGEGLPGGPRRGGTGASDHAAVHRTVSVQEEVGRLRRGLLGGRGPGASEQEVARHTRDRPTVGVVPTVLERELVHVSAGRARGDLDAIESDLEPVRAHLAATLDQLAGRLVPRRLVADALHTARTQFEGVLGAPPGSVPAGDGTTAEGAPAATPGPGGSARDEWWWRVAARAAVVGALGTLGLVLLTVTARRRLARRPRRGGAGRARWSRRSPRPHRPAR